MIYHYVLCLGDSQTYGSRDEFGRAWPFELCDVLSEKYSQYWVPIVRAEPGLTSAGLLRKVYDWASVSEVYRIVVLVGANDSREVVKTPPHIYQRNLEGILRTLKVKHPEASLFVCTIPDIGPFGAPDFTRKCQVLIDEYNNVIQSLSAKWGYRVVDLTGLPTDCYADSVHFNNKGSREIATRVMKAFEDDFEHV